MLTPLPVEEHLGCFQFMTKAAVNIYVQVFVWIKFSTHLCKYLGARLLDWVAKLCLTLLRNWQIFFRNNCTILPSSGNGWELLLLGILSSTDCRSVWILAILVEFSDSVKYWYLIIVLIYNSQTTGKVDNLFICLLGYHITSLRCLFRSFAHFLIGLLNLKILSIVWITVLY